MRMPAMKNSAPHTIRISMVWPKSGSITSSETSISSSTSAIEVAGISGFLVDSANSQAATTTKAGLADSEAWMLRPSSVIQRREPFTSGPSKRVATIRMIESTNTISAVRRICRGDMKETPIKTKIDGNRYITWWLKKWNGSSPIRTATGGLAASDNTTPLSISARIAPSIGRSTVHHQSDSGLRSSRESMGGPRAKGTPIGAPGGFQGGNGIWMFLRAGRSRARMLGQRTASHILVGMGAPQPPDHDEGEQRQQRDAQNDDAGLLRGDCKHEIGVAVRQAAHGEPGAWLNHRLH